MGAIPKHLAHFEILRRLGVGGMAEVFLAKKRGAENTFKLLVLKRILPAFSSSARFRAMFAEEANLATRLNHPNIVQVYEFQDYGDEGSLLSMEYVEGLDLGKLLSGAKSRDRRIPPWVAAYIIAEAAKGLHYAHERKDERGQPLDIVHRDVSPQNVLLSFEGAVKIADFGVAAANLFRDEVGVLKGKFGYMSPEQARGERVDRRSDIYALGVVLHEMLTGRGLHPGLSGDELLSAVRQGNIEPPSTFVRDIPPELEAIAMRALAVRREDRFQSARDLAGAIARAMLQRQVLVDAATLETSLQQLAGPEAPPPPRPEDKAHAELSTGAAEALAASRHTVAVGRRSISLSTPSSPASSSLQPSQSPSSSLRRLAQEVRHVALLTLRIHGLDKLRQCGDSPQAVRVENDIRLMLEQLAFKRGARLTWNGRDKARAVLGLMANPTRASSDAASMAIDVHEFLDDSAEDWPVPIQASVGIVRAIASGQRDSQGHLIAHKLQPPAEYLAQVLGEQAPCGHTWVAGGIFRLIRDEFVWNDASSLALDQDQESNAPSTMRVHELLRPLSREEREVLKAECHSDLVGRDTEKADLQSAFHQASQPTGEHPHGRLIARALVGEMGIGKSALVSSFRRELPSSVRAVQIDCLPAQAELALSCVAELIRALTGTSTEQSLDQALAAILDVLGPSGPGLQPVAFRLAELASGKHAEHYDDEDVAFVQKLLVTGLRKLLAASTQATPMLLAVDGLQWADSASMELLAQLLAEPEQLPILVLLVTRPDDHVLPFIEQLVHIELRGLRPDEQVRLVSGRLGVQHGVFGACADLIPRVGGNPFFLLEMVDALLERGTLEIQERDGALALVRSTQNASTLQPLPSTLEQLIADRLNELPQNERDVVQWLAVAGGPLSPRDLISLGRFTSAEPIEKLCARGTCDRRGELIEFRHPIAREVAYNAIEPHERVAMHRRIGEHLAQSSLAQGLSAVIVARHLARGKSPSRAADFYLEAAQAARSSYQTQLATKYFQRALTLLEAQDKRRFRAHQSLESICRLLGRHQERRRHLIALRAMARDATQPQWVAMALTRTAIFNYDEGLYSKCVTVCQQAYEAARLCQAPSLEVEALSTQGEALRELGDVQGGLAACDRALQVAKSAQVSPRIRADVLRSRGVLLRRVGRVREAVDCYVEAIAVFRRVGARRSEARAMNALAFAMFVLERFEDCIALALSSISIDLAIGGRFQLAKTLSNIGQAYMRLGDLARSMAYLKRARDAHERYDDQDSRADTLIVSGEVMLEAGDQAAAHSFCLDAAALNSVTASAYDDVHEKILHARLDRASNDSKGAVQRACAARQAAEAQALISFYCHATALEAAARLDLGEQHTAILLATTALGSLSTMQGSEYGLEVCLLCWETLQRAGSPQAKEAAQQAQARVQRIAEAIRDARLKALFLNRPLVRRILTATGPLTDRQSVL